MHCNFTLTSCFDISVIAAVGGLNIFNWASKPTDSEGGRSPITTPTDGNPRFVRSSIESDISLHAPAAQRKKASDVPGFNMTPKYEPNPVDFGGFSMKPTYEPNPPFLTTPDGDMPPIPHAGEEPPPLPPPRRPVSPNPLDGSRRLSPPKQISLDDNIPHKNVHRSMSEGSMEPPPPFQRQLSDPPDSEPPPLPARGAVARPQQFAPIREDIEDLEYPPTFPPSPPRTPPIPKRNSPKINELKAKFERPTQGAAAATDHSKDSSGKPRLPQRLGERTSPDGRARPLPGEPQVDVLIDGVPPPLPAKGSQTQLMQNVALEDLEVSSIQEF